jgi:hypothetical protein
MSDKPPADEPTEVEPPAGPPPPPPPVDKPAAKRETLFPSLKPVVLLGFVAVVVVAALIGFLVLGGDDSKDSDTQEAADTTPPPPELPEGAVAFVADVDDGEIDQAALDAAVDQAAASQGGKTPGPGTPKYNAVLVPAVSDLLLGVWVRGEATERDVEVTETEIDDELGTIIKEQFGGQEKFEKFLDDSGFSEEEARERVELQLLTQCIQDQVVPQDPEAESTATSGCEGEEEVDVTDEEIDTFYDENSEQFTVGGKTQPLDDATRDQIRQQLVTQEQQEAVTEFQDDFTAKWRERTVCSDDLVADDPDGTVEDQLAERCANFELPETPEPEEVPPGTVPPGAPPGTAPPGGAPPTVPPG